MEAVPFVPTVIWRWSWSVTAFLLVVLLALPLPFLDGLIPMLGGWELQPEYSHGILIPVIAVFLIWQKSDQLARMHFSGSWWGVTLVVLACIMLALGKQAALQVFIQYSFLITLAGLLLALTGIQPMKLLVPSLFLSVFMIPLPAFLLSSLSAKLQLFSSQIGVWFIRLFGISVYLEGNIIDLGGYKLQVAEACSGLRYLFPLMTLGFIMACFFKTAWWKRILLFLSSIPLTVLMNSFRIGTIGVMVEHWGTGMAEGFLHEFQGWAVFMTSTGLLLLEMMLLSSIGSERRPWREVFGVELAARLPRSAPRQLRRLPKSFYAASILFVTASVAISFIPKRDGVVPTRESFASFPNRIGAWEGRRSAIEPVYLDALKLDDYLMEDFTRLGESPINFYVAWYNSQGAGESAHSPRSCLPGGGWTIDSIRKVEVPSEKNGAHALSVNRVEISFGDQRQLVYYWFQQRGRNITNEYAVKWYLLLDSITRRRTDGALVRVITRLKAGEVASAGDARLAEFINNAVPNLQPHIPD